MVAGQYRMIDLWGKGINIYKHTHSFVNWLTVEISENSYLYLLSIIHAK